MSAGPSSAALGPGASYDASGMWRFVVADVHGNVDETFDTNVSQDANGNLSFLDEDGSPVSLERLGTGVVVTYRLSLTAEEDDCEIRVQGTARLDTRTNTLNANVLVRAVQCSQHEVLQQVVTGTKLN
jgi:hypothetical protein